MEKSPFSKLFDCDACDNSNIMTKSSREDALIEFMSEKFLATLFALFFQYFPEEFSSYLRDIEKSPFSEL